MKIEHIAMYVNDIEHARDFLLSILMEKLMTDITTRRQIFAHISFHLMMEQDWK